MRSSTSKEYFDDIDELLAPSGVADLDNQDLLDVTFAYENNHMWMQLIEEGGPIADFLVGFAHRMKNS